jgi:hypothetical protein
LVAERLGALFRRNGYMRKQDIGRLKAEGHGAYKKGDEVRLVADSIMELEVIRRLLRQAGFRPGAPFRKAKQWGQPIYGRQAVARFMALIGEEI